MPLPAEDPQSSSSLCLLSIRLFAKLSIVGSLRGFRKSIESSGSLEEENKDLLRTFPKRVGVGKNEACCLGGAGRAFLAPSRKSRDVVITRIKNSFYNITHVYVCEEHIVCLRRIYAVPNV